MKGVSKVSSGSYVLMKKRIDSICVQNADCWTLCLRSKQDTETIETESKFDIRIKAGTGVPNQEDNVTASRQEVEGLMISSSNVKSPWLLDILLHYKLLHREIPTSFFMHFLSQTFSQMPFSVNTVQMIGSLG